MRNSTCLIFILILINFNLIGQSLDQKIKEFDSYIEKSKAEWRAPGLAVAVVKDGKVILKKGYGVRELGKEDKVDTETLFSCASTTKAMTAACIGMLVDEGKIKW